MTHPVIGALTPDSVALLLDTPFDCFDTGTVHGLARVMDEGRRLELLAIAAHHPQHGHGSRFLDECEAHYATIRVLDVMNTRFAAMLARRGYAPSAWWIDREHIDGMEWTR